MGGTLAFWNSTGFEDLADIQIFLFNQTEQKANVPYFHFVQGVASNLACFADKQFDLVFSNSVIEHLFTWENQVKMAQEVRRVGKHYFIQTPNYWFPIEPHFVFPCFQYFPKSLRVWLISNFSLGFYEKFHDKEQARTQVEEIKLLSLRQVKDLFPGAKIYKEKFWGLHKSMIAYDF